MIKVTSAGGHEADFTTMDDAIYGIVELVVDRGWCIVEVRDTVTDQLYSCVWSVTLQKED